MNIKPNLVIKRIASCVAILFVGLLVLQIIFPSIAAASPLPAKDERHVYDRGEMFVAGEIPGIEETIRNANKHVYYVVTVSTFGELSGNDFAEDLYDAWELVPSDVLMVLSKNDRRIQMYFKDPELQYKLEQLPDNYAGMDYHSRPVIDRLVGKNFTPLAKQGEFADGIIALVKETERISAQEIADPPLVNENVTTLSNDFSTQENLTDLTREIGDFLIWIAIFTLAVVASVVVFILIPSRLGDIRKKNVKLRTLTEDVLQRIVSCFPRLDTLKRYHRGGKATVKLTELHREFVNLERRVEYMLNGINKGKVFGHFNIFNVNSKSRDEAYEEHISFLNNYEASLKRITKELVGYETLHIAAEKMMSKANTMIQSLTEQLDQISYEQQVRVKHLNDSLAEIRVSFEDHFQRGQNDLEDVSKQMGKSIDQLSNLLNFVQELPSLLQELKGIPSVLKEEQLRLVSLVEDKKLDVNFDPFEDLNQAMQEMNVLNTLAEQGDWLSAKHVHTKISRLIMNSKESMRHQIKLSEQVEKDLDALKNHILNFHFDESRYQNEYLRVKQDFDIDSLKDMETDRDDILHLHDHINNVHGTCESLYRDRRFKVLEKELNNASVNVNKITVLEKRVLNKYKACETKRDQLKESLTSFHDRYLIAFKQLRKEEDLNQPHSSVILKLVKLIDEQFAALILSLDTYPVQLSQVNDSVIEWKGLVDKTVDQMNDLLYQRKQANEAIKKMTERLSLTFTLSNGQSVNHTLNIKKHARNTQDSLDTMNQLLNMGLYAQVLHNSSNAESHLQQLERAQEEASRQELMRQSQSSSYSSYSSYNSNSSESSYYSSSSPSYDNGSNDSGSSSGGDSW